MEKMMRLTMVMAIVVCGLSMLASCSSDNDDPPEQQEYYGVPLVILDTSVTPGQVPLTRHFSSFFFHIFGVFPCSLPLPPFDP